MKKPEQHNIRMMWMSAGDRHEARLKANRSTTRHFDWLAVGLAFAVILSLTFCH